MRFWLFAFVFVVARQAIAEPVASGAPAREPAASEQDPKPYFAPKERERRLFMLDLGPDLGIVARPADSDVARYSAGVSYGLHGRVEIRKWLGFRGFVARSSHAVSVPDNALLERTRADQPNLSVLQIGARIEPTWPISPEARLWLGLGVAWDRIWADKPTLSGRQVQAANRTGVGVEYSAALGGTVDIVPNWLALTLSLSAARVAHQSGTMFEPLQAVDEAVSRPEDPLVYIAGLPKFEGAYSALIGVGLLL